MTAVARYLVVGIDDDAHVRESIESLVESAGYSPAVFSSAEEFLDSGIVSDANCLITDVRMPGMNGIELQRRIRLDHPRIPVIFITAHYDDQLRHEALDGGAMEFIYKPFDAEKLLHAVRRALHPV